MEFRPFAVDLKVRFRGATRRTGVLLRGIGPDGADAWGEYSPFPDYDAERASRWWAAAMEAANGVWGPAGSIRFERADVAVNSIVPEVEPALAAALAVAGGCTTAKVKVSGREGVPADIARVEAVASALGAGGRIRIDVNGGWSVDEAVTALALLERAAQAGGVDGLEYVEQPCATIDELAQLRRRTRVPVAADESVRVPGQVAPVLAAHAADVVILKAAPLGGVRRALELADEATVAGVPCVVSSAMESSVGLAAGVALARAIPVLEGIDRAHGLGTGALLASDTVARSLVPIGGRISNVKLEVTA